MQGSMNEGKLFTPFTLGPLNLKNRSIRAAAFEGMCPGNLASDQLLNYHRAVAAGGVGMTTLAYASVCRSGLSFPHQLWLRKEAITGLRSITNAVHAEGAAASVQIGHCGNMSKKSVAGQTPLGASTGFNMYSPTWARGMRYDEIKEMAVNFGQAVHTAREAGFDAVEVHAGHGYLISQFLSPWTNRRKDEYGGSPENRMRFMKEMMQAVMEAAGGDMAVIVKINMHDGFRGGMETDECLEVAGVLEKMGVHALVLSGGFVSKAPMYVMRGEMPVRTLTHYMENPWLKIGIRMFGHMMIPGHPYKEAYFLDDALKFRQKLKLPLIYVGGLLSRQTIEGVLDQGFEMVSMARALLHDPAFISKLKNGTEQRSACKHSNYCIARMYSKEMACHHSIEGLPASLRREIEKAERE